MTAHASGIAIMDTASPAMNDRAGVARLLPDGGIGVGVDLEDRDPAEVLAQPSGHEMACGCSRKNPQSP